MTDAQWKKGGTLKLIYDVLRGRVRRQEGRSPQPTAGIIDSQSVKMDVEAETRGYDSNKKIKGRKRHLLVDTLGLVLVAWITVADVQDRDAAAAVLPLAAEQFPTLQKVWADAAYHGPCVEAIAQRVLKWGEQARHVVPPLHPSKHKTHAFSWPSGCALCCSVR